MREGLFSLEKKRRRGNVIVFKYVESHFKEGGGEPFACVILPGF